MCVPPATDIDRLHSVKWHPREPDTLAVASESKVYLIDLANTHALHGQPLPQSDLYHIGQIFNLASVSGYSYPSLKEPMLNTFISARGRI